MPVNLFWQLKQGKSVTKCSDAIAFFFLVASSEFTRSLSTITHAACGSDIVTDAIVLETESYQILKRVSSRESDQVTAAEAGSA